MTSTPNQLSNIKNFAQLIRYLEEELDWPCQEYGFEEITFKYTSEELGIKEEDSVQIKQIHQLRPFYQGQPWGIFFIEFEKKRLPVALLRRVLSHLMVKKRASANSADKAVWNMDNLLFISAFGDETSDQREIAFAHFHQEVGDLPTLKVLGWDGADTVLKMEYVNQELHEKLHWPKDPRNVESWQSQWSSAFRHKPGFVIKTANALADRLAELARGIRGAAETLMTHESEKGPLRQLYKAFQTALIHDLTEADFADTYAQTITYGLLTAAISRTDMSGGIYGTALVASNVTDLVPITNPFLKEMLESFIHAGDHKGGIQFDELGIQDVVDLLRGEETDLPAVLRDFDNKTPGEDPVIQFYEHFLSAYNKKLKIQRGVFYTPKPVVSYIVRSVHELLKTEFGLEDGLADITTWGEMEKKIPGLKRPESTDPNSPFVMILDPATGTATFLVEVIDVIFKTLTDKWEKQHLNKTAQEKAWNEYVPKHLLPRVYGFELMMAPYAIAHMKISLKLHETGYQFSRDERVCVYLTNSLEPASGIAAQQTFTELNPALAHESESVNAIKRLKKFTVVVGNPPYSVKSYNNGMWIRGLLLDFKMGLNETKINLDDDYIKFLRFVVHLSDSSGIGIISMVTNNGFLSGVTHRQIRHHLYDCFTGIRILNLHGDSRYGEDSPCGWKNENVFDIQQGVCVWSLIRCPTTKLPKIAYSDIWGSREQKNTQLLSTDVINYNALNPKEPLWLFKPSNLEFTHEYEEWPSLSEWMPNSSNGIETHKDSLTLYFTPQELEATTRNLLLLPIESARIKLNVGEDGRDWNLCEAKKSVQTMMKKGVKYSQITYRPYDFRYTMLNSETGGFIAYPRWDVMSNLKNIENNLAIISARLMARGGQWDSCLASRYPTEKKTGDSTRSSTIFPLFLVTKEAFNFGKKYRPNFSAQLFPKVQRFYDTFGGSHDEDAQARDLFGYLFALLHSSVYRERYKEQLKTDFPHLPLTSNPELYFSICVLGLKLVELNLLDATVLNIPLTHFVGKGDNTVQSGYPKYHDDIVFINNAQGFEGVTVDIWEFHIGGYQVCHKWLKDRKGRQLSDEDIAHYQKIIVALQETIRLMGEIDEVIEEHGGCPLK